MIKVIRTIDLSQVKKPSKPKRWIIRSKNRKKVLDVQNHPEYGELTEGEAEDCCRMLNSKRDGRFYWSNLITGFNNESLNAGFDDLSSR